MPAVSVIIPTYNRAALLRRSVESVLNQSFRDFEVIIVDDASTDETVEVVKLFEDGRIKYLRREKRGGEAAARNTGIAHATGKYIASHDSDDEWMPQKLAKQMRIFEGSSEGIGVVYTGFWRIEGNRKTYLPPSRIDKKEGRIHRELLRGNFVGTPTTVVKRECFEKSGCFDERLRHLVDWEMWIRISERYHFMCVNEPLVISQRMRDSVSTNEFALIEAHEYILKKHFNKFADYREILAGEEYWIGNLWCQIGNKRRGREYFKRAISTRPLNVKYLGAWILSFMSHEKYGRLVELNHKLLSIYHSHGEKR
jgi:glycosyltransferase involved in cell wall biosynthesis